MTHRIRLVALAGAMAALSACASAPTNPWQADTAAPETAVTPTTNEAMQTHAAAPPAEPKAPAAAPAPAPAMEGMVGADTIVAAMSKSGEQSRQVYGLGDGPKVSFGEALLTFDVGSATIKPSSYAQLDEIGKALQTPELQSGKYLIVGHTDRSGSYDSNLDLSKRRAASVLNYLQSKFILDATITTEGRSYDEPANAADPYASENRRVNLVRID